MDKEHVVTILPPSSKLERGLNDERGAGLDLERITEGLFLWVPSFESLDVDWSSPFYNSATILPDDGRRGAGSDLERIREALVRDSASNLSSLAGESDLWKMMAQERPGATSDYEKEDTFPAAELTNMGNTGKTVGFQGKTRSPMNMPTGDDASSSTFSEHGTADEKPVTRRRRDTVLHDLASSNPRNSAIWCAKKGKCQRRVSFAASHTPPVSFISNEHCDRSKKVVREAPHRARHYDLSRASDQYLRIPRR